MNVREEAEEMAVATLAAGEQGGIVAENRTRPGGSAQKPGAGHSRTPVLYGSPAASVEQEEAA